VDMKKMINYRGKSEGLRTQNLMSR
jgi:hypothetical protein